MLQSMPANTSKLPFSATGRASFRRSRCLSLWLGMGLLLTACGGGGGDGAAVDGSEVEPPLPPPALRQASAQSLVAAGCTGGSTTGTNYPNAEVEPWAAIDPSNASRMLAVWQQDRWSNGGARALVSAVSNDGGVSWQRSLLPFSRCGGALPGSVGDFERASDPWLDITPDGTAVVMGLAFSGGVLTDGGSNAMLASRSTDGGRSWSTPAVLVRDGGNAFNDKNALTADPTANGFVYAVWDRLDAAGNGPTLLARSTDAGVTWEPARVIYTPTAGTGVSQTIGNRIVVLPASAERGVLVNLFTQIDTVAGVSTTRIGIIRSTDRGLNWGAPVFINNNRAVSTRDDVTTNDVRDGGVIASIAAGPDNGLWVVWHDGRFSGGVRNAIALSRSTDGGRTWSAPMAINRVATAGAFTPAVHVRADGQVGVLHYDLRNNTPDPTTFLANAWLLTSRDGNTWVEAPVAGPFDLLLAPRAGALFLGDYQGLVSGPSAFVPVLVTTGTQDNNRTDVFAPLVTVASAVAVAAQPVQPLWHSSRPAPMVGATAHDVARSRALAQAAHDAVGQAMEWRLPGWRARVQGAAGRQ
jgi:hypothetical protein